MALGASKTSIERKFLYDWPFLHDLAVHKAMNISFATIRRVRNNGPIKERHAENSPHKLVSLRPVWSQYIWYLRAQKYTHHIVR